MSEQCKSCIHKSVCAYKPHYEDVVKLYEKAKEECGKYPWFKFKIECIQYRKEDFPLIKAMAESEDKDADKKCTYKETGCGSCKRQLDCPIEADKAESEE